MLQTKFMVTLFIFFIIFIGSFTLSLDTATAVEIKYAVLRVDQDGKLPISRLDIPPEDLGFASAKLATADNLTTGQFLGHKYELETIATKPDGISEAMDSLIEKNIQYVVLVGATKEIVEKLSQSQNDILFLNADSPGVTLRDISCQSNVLHVSPSRSMLTDALSQFLMWKKWDEWVLIHGSHPADRLLAESYRNSARKFGATIVEEREFEDTGGARRTDTGHALVQKQIPIFLQGLVEHDVIVVADETDIFATYLPYHTWESKIVAGSAGLRPLTWHAAQEAWGGTQLQRRFEAQANRTMREIDYQVWLSLRIIGEAVTRTGSEDVEENRLYILGSDFELAAFKGTKVTFRPWNG